MSAHARIYMGFVVARDENENSKKKVTMEDCSVQRLSLRAKYVVCRRAGAIFLDGRNHLIATSLLPCTLPLPFFLPSLQPTFHRWPPRCPASMRSEHFALSLIFRLIFLSCYDPQDWTWYKLLLFKFHHCIFILDSLLFLPLISFRWKTWTLPKFSSIELRLISSFFLLLIHDEERSLSRFSSSSLQRKSSLSSMLRHGARYFVGKYADQVPFATFQKRRIFLHSDTIADFLHLSFCRAYNTKCVRVAINK